MNTDRLRYFAAVAETGNLRKASELVGIAPPSMSKAISVLESELGFKVIHQEGRGIGLTPEGLEVYKLSLPLLQEVRNFRQNIANRDKTFEQLRIGTFEVFSSYFLARFFATETEYNAQVIEMVPGKIEKSILEGVVDIGFTYIPSPDPKLEYFEIGSFFMKIFGKSKWRNKDFSMWPFAIPTTELKIYSSEIDTLDMWPRAAPKRFIKHQFELLETALQTSGSGHTVLHCPDFVVKLYNERVKALYKLDQLPIPPKYGNPKPIKIYLVCKKGSCPPRLEGKLAKFLRSLS